MQANGRAKFLLHNEAEVKTKAIIFDGDDTIWAIQPLFDSAKAQFATIVNNKLEIEYSEALAKLDEIDLANVAKFGFSPYRFPTSLVDTLVFLYGSKGLTPSDSEKKQVYLLGSSIFEQTPELLPGAEDVLVTLSRSFRLILYTLGDPGIQEKFIDKLNIRHFFDDSIYVVPEKNSHQLLKILEANDLVPQEVWVVGNSLRSDINPALRLGIRCIWG
jgi:putative hydrolase of the HAD superfamily